MTARDEMLAALPAIRARTGRDTFTPQEVIDELQRRGTAYKPSTIRTRVVSRLCADAPDHHGRTYDDFQRSVLGSTAAGEPFLLGSAFTETIESRRLRPHSEATAAHARSAA